MFKRIGLFSLAVIAAGALFFACNKNNETTVEEYVDEALYSIQERGGLGKYGCYELVFPVTVNFPDSTTLEVNSYEELKDAIRSWRENNPGSGGGQGHGHHGHHGGLADGNHPTLAFPFSVISQDGELITVDDAAELKEIREACGGGSFGHHGPNGHGQHGLACFELKFPVTLVFPDSSTAEAADHAALHTLLHDWKANNPGATERPELQFPVTVIMKDDSTEVTVDSKAELKALKEDCE